MSIPWAFSSASTPIIYHYTSATAARAVVETRTFWLSEHSAMNDTSEFTYARDRLLALLSNRAVYMDTLVRHCVLFAISALSKDCGMVLGSFSARKDDLGQWRSYASNGAGCVLGVEASYLECDAGVAINRVLYDEVQVHRMLDIALEVIQQQYVDEPGNVATLMDFARRAAADLFKIKHPGFADEREVRISRMLVRGEDGSLSDVGGNRADGSKVPPIPVRKRTSSFGETNYVALPFSIRNGSSAVVCVGLGPTMSDTDRVEHRAFFEAHGLTVWHSTVPYRT